MIQKQLVGEMIILWFCTGLIFGHNLAKYTRKTLQAKVTACCLLISALGFTTWVLW